VAVSRRKSASVSRREQLTKTQSALRRLTLSLHDQTVELAFPKSLERDLRRLFPSPGHIAPAACDVTLTEDDEGYVISSSGTRLAAGMSRDQLLLTTLEEVTKQLITRLRSAVALHAAAVAYGNTSVLIPGVSGSGKSSIAAWLLDRGFTYLTDEVAVLLEHGRILGLSRAVVLKPGAAEVAATLSALQNGSIIECGSHILGLPADVDALPQPRGVGLMIFPQFEAGGDVKIQPMSPGEAGLKLIASNLNARNLTDGGLGSIAALARETPAVALRYGKFEQLAGTLDELLRLVIDKNWSVAEVTRFFGAFSTPGEIPPAPIVEIRHPIPDPTPRKDAKVSLTVGMTSYDDYDGAYFSLQAMRLYHQEVLGEVEFLLIDNHPDGACSKPLKHLETSIPNYRYVPKNGRHGTAVRECVFEEASGKFVLCMDSHVFLVPGALERLLQYLRDNPNTLDLLQGPLLGDDLKTLSTHFEPNWRDGMFGYWALDERGRDPDTEPFEIPMQGLGVFACRRQAWPGFNSEFRGFGGEEGYIHEKFRQRGGRTLCLPFLRWVHRFNRPLGVPYPNSWHDRIRNYVIGFQELGLPTEPMEEHFSKLLGAGPASSIFRSIKDERGHSSTKSAPLSRSIDTACSTS